MFSLCLVFVTAFVAQPTMDRPPGTVVVQADSLVVQGHRVRARRRAIDRALRMAVRQEAIRLGGSGTISPTMSRLVLSRFRRFVVSYRMLREWFVGQGASGSYHVSLEVHVDGVALARGFGQSQRKETGPCFTVSGPSDVVRALASRLRVHGISVPCRGAGASVTVSCAVVQQGGVAAMRGATVHCEVVRATGSSQRRWSVVRSGLGATAAQAIGRAQVLAGIELGRKILGELSATCRRPWTVVIDGATGFLIQFRVVQTLIRRFSAAAVSAMQFSRGRVIVRLFLNRCVKDLASVLVGLQVSGARLTIGKKRPGWLSIRLDPEEPDDR
ncbi:MAG: hypothetical protein J7M25_12585 [Deltaproteobacteria bacterium]|nr:hypothetical protein [Deltaproteobacteria bacterium]